MELSVAWARSFSLVRISSFVVRSTALPKARMSLSRLKLVLDEIVLRALVDCMNCIRFVVEAGQQHNGDVGCGCAYATDRTQSFWIGQSQVQQDNINGILSKKGLGVCQTFDVGQLEGV